MVERIEKTMAQLIEMITIILFAITFMLILFVCIRTGFNILRLIAMVPVIIGIYLVITIGTVQVPNVNEFVQQFSQHSISTDDTMNGDDVVVTTEQME